MYKVYDEEVGIVRWMKEVWKDKWLVKPNNVEVIIDDINDEEKKYLDRVLRWVYKRQDDNNSIVINGVSYKVDDFRKEPATLSVV